MTREEEITKQSILYTSQVCPACISGDNIFDEEVRDLNRNKAFEAGAKWAYIDDLLPKGGKDGIKSIL